MIFCDKCNCFVIHPLKGETTCSTCLGLSDKEIIARIVAASGFGDWAKEHMVTHSLVEKPSKCFCDLCAGVRLHMELTKADPNAHKDRLSWAKDPDALKMSEP